MGGSNRSSRLRNGLLGAALGASSALAAGDARADEEAWLWFEERVPIVRTDVPTLPRVDFRVFGDLRFSREAEGPRIGAVRFGPIFWLDEHFFLGAHTSTWAFRTPDGTCCRWEREIRAELEPNLIARFGPVLVSDRNRFEYRRRADSDLWFYRNMLRLTFGRHDARWLPTLWDEPHIEVESPRLTENRLAAGIMHMIEPTTRIELGYLFRSRNLPTGFDHGHVVYLFLFLDVPRRPLAAHEPEPPSPRAAPETVRDAERTAAPPTETTPPPPQRTWGK